MLSTIASVAMGFLGTALTTYSNYKMEKLKLEQQQLANEHELRYLEAETAASIREAEIGMQIQQRAIEGEVQLAEVEAFQQSIASEKPSLPSQWLELLLSKEGYSSWFTIPVGLVLLTLLGIGDVLKNMMRSVLTLYCLALASWVSYKCWVVLEPSIHTVLPTEALTTWLYIVDVVLMLATTLVTWWFGDKRMAKHLMHLKEKTR